MRRSQDEIRLVAVVGLLLIPIAFLGWLFLSQSMKDLSATWNEMRGVAYLRATVPLLGGVANRRAPINEALLDRFFDARSIHDQALRSAESSDRLARALDGTEFNRTEAMRAARVLISRIGEQSNLILDPDLDSYYLMDIALMRVPEIIDVSSEVVEAVTTSDLTSNSPDRIADLMLTAARLRAAVGGLTQSYQLAFRNNRSGIVSRVLARDTERYSAEMMSFIEDLELLVNAHTITASALDDLARDYDALLGSTIKTWETTANQLETLLNARVSRQKAWLNIAIGISIFMTATAVALAVTVLRRLIHSLDDKIVFLAHHDSMTNLKNRAAFKAAMDEAVESSARDGTSLALHILDVDRFKTINDTLGHGTGDALLKVIAERLAKVAGTRNVVGRLGGDEFVVLQKDVSTEMDAITFAERIVTSLRTPVLAGEVVLKSSASVGTAIMPLHATTQEALMQSADVALYAAKAAGRDQYRLFSADLDAAQRRRLAIEQTVRVALEKDLFYLYFQPQFDATGSSLVGFEALLRLRGSDGVPISPSEFVPVAEQMGLIGEIGAWVLKKACAVAMNWPDNIIIAVNLSPLQFTTGNVCDPVRNALVATGLPPHRLQVEITEGVIMENTEAVLGQLRDIRKLGVSVAMDDFGSGYSSLSYLWQFPFDTIKIDRSFMTGLDSDYQNAQNILLTIINLGHTLGMLVTAEGVETPAQAAMLAELGCDHIQGYLYGTPVAEQDVASIILTSFRSSVLAARTAPKRLRTAV